MAGETKGPLRHIVLLTVEKKEDVPEVVKTLSDMAKEVVKHVSCINFEVNSDLGLQLNIQRPSSDSFLGNFCVQYLMLLYDMFFRKLGIRAIPSGHWNSQFLAKKIEVPI